jgi:hypothetical protein
MKVLRIDQRREQKLEANINKQRRRREVMSGTNRKTRVVLEEGYNRHYKEWQR